jgi:hypothetical protein
VPGVALSSKVCSHVAVVGLAALLRSPLPSCISIRLYGLTLCAGAGTVSFSTGTMTPLFVARLFEERAHASGAAGRGRGQRAAAGAAGMGWDAFQDFLLAWEHCGSPAGVRYFFPVLDLRGRGHLTQARAQPGLRSATSAKCKACAVEQTNVNACMISCRTARQVALSCSVMPGEECARACDALQSRSHVPA